MAVNSTIRPALAKLPDVSVQTVPSSKGAIAGLLRLQRNEIDIGINALADVTYLAYTGQLDAVSRFGQLRGMAVLDVSTFHAIVGRSVPVTEIRQLRGRRVVIGAPDTSTALIGESLLRASGLSREEVHARQVPYVAAIAGLEQGDVDAVFMIQMLGNDLVMRATRAGARVIDVDSSAIEELRRQRPHVRRALIPSGTYAGQDRPIRTLGVDRLLICRADLAEDLVYRFLDAFFATPPGTPPPTTLDRAPATPVPLHPGAARYYRQRELWP